MNLLRSTEYTIFIFLNCFKYRDNYKKVSMENEKLHQTLFQAEKDTIEVITYLKKEDLKKDEQVYVIVKLKISLTKLVAINIYNSSKILKP